MIVTISSIANAGLITFDIGWSGADLGNNATAFGTIVIDDTIFINGADNQGTSWVSDFTMTVTGTGAAPVNTTTPHGVIHNLFILGTTELNLISFRPSSSIPVPTPATLLFSIGLIALAVKRRTSLISKKFSGKYSNIFAAFHFKT